MTKFRCLILGLISILSLSIVSPALAYPVESVQLDPNRQDFVVGPGKTDVILNPGESRVIELMVSNRTGIDREFQIKFSDFTGSNDLTSPVVLTDEKSANTMKDYVSVPENIFFLKNGQRSRIPVTITAPVGSEPGGRYVSILVSTLTPLTKTPKDADTAQGGVPLITQTGTLVFVTIPGDIKIEGSLIDFYTKNKQKFFSRGKDVMLDLIFKNTGNLHLNPYGSITVKNIFGQQVKGIEVEPWFAMPNSLRFRGVALVSNSVDDNFMLGRYTAEAKIFRGYDDKFDTKSLTFWVLPWKLLLIVLLVIFLLLWVIRSIIKYISTHFERAPVAPETPEMPIPPSDSQTPTNPNNEIKS